MIRPVFPIANDRWSVPPLAVLTSVYVSASLFGSVAATVPTTVPTALFSRTDNVDGVPAGKLGAWRPDRTWILGSNLPAVASVKVATSPPPAT